MKRVFLIFFNEIQQLHPRWGSTYFSCESKDHSGYVAKIVRAFAGDTVQYLASIS